MQSTYASFNSFNIEKCFLINYLNLILTSVLCNQYFFKIWGGGGVMVLIVQLMYTVNFVSKAANQNVIMVDISCTSALALVVIALCLNCQLVFIVIMKYGCIIVTPSAKIKQKALLLESINEYNCRFFRIVISVLIPFVSF